MPVLDAAAGLLLGLSLAAPPGPMNALIARESTAHGWRHGLRVGVAAPVADTLYLVLLVVGLEFVLVDPWVARVAAGLGALVMAWLAWATVRARSEAQAAPRATFGAAFLMAAANPFQLTWWLTAGFTFLLDRGAAGVLGFLAGIFGWVALLAFLCAKGAERWAWFTPWVSLLSADLLLAFSLILAGRAWLG